MTTSRRLRIALITGGALIAGICSTPPRAPLTQEERLRVFSETVLPRLRREQAQREKWNRERLTEQPLWRQ
jgi:hypothetical protein